MLAPVYSTVIVERACASAGSVGGAGASSTFASFPGLASTRRETKNVAGAAPRSPSPTATAPEPLTRPRDPDPKPRPGSFHVEADVAHHGDVEDQADHH